MPYKIFVNGFPLNASELNTFLMPQTISTFEDATARDGAIENPVEGQFVYLTTTNQLQNWDGSAWIPSVPSVASTVQSKSANYTIAAGDVNSFIYVTAAATMTIANVLAPGESINFVSDTTSTVSFAAGAGVSLRSKESKLNLSAQYSAATITCKSSGEYYLVGDLA